MYNNNFIGHSQVLKLLKEDEILEGVYINLNKELGRGSYATVYQAEWRSLSCVAKVFHTVIFPSYPAETWKQLAREIELLQHIRHPNIVQLLGFTDTHSKIPSVIMERLDTNLTTLIKEHHSLLSFNMQVCILHDVAIGLNFLHGHKEPIIHRDLASNNILLTEHLVAKISDLGLAKHIKSAEQQAGSFAGFGTQDFMPPEVLGQKPPHISPKTDVFSFGVVMLQIATGRLPDVRGRLNVDAEADSRRKHHLDLLGEKNLFRPLILKCLNNKSVNRPTAIVLCTDLKRFGVARISTLKLTKAFEEEKIKLMDQLHDKDAEFKQKLKRQLDKAKNERDDAVAAKDATINTLEQQYRDAVKSNQGLRITLKRTQEECEQEKMTLKRQLGKVETERDNPNAALQQYYHCAAGKNQGLHSSIALRGMQEFRQEMTLERQLDKAKNVRDDTIAAKDASLHERTLELQQQYDHATGDNQKLSIALNRAQKELQNLKKQLDKAKNERDDAVADKDAIINALQQECHHAAESNQELRNTLKRTQEEFRQEKMTLERQLHKAENERGDANHAVAAKNATIDYMHARMFDLQQQYEHEKQELKEVKGQLHKAKNERDHANHVVATKNATIDDMDEEMFDLEQQCEREKQELKKVKRKLQKAKNERDDANHDVATKDATIHDMRARTFNLQQQYEHEKQELKKALQRAHATCSVVLGGLLICLLASYSYFCIYITTD